MPPQVRLVQPVDGQVFVNPAHIELVAVARDPDGWVPAVQFYAGDRLLGTSEVVFIREPDPGLPQTFSFVWVNVPPGRHELRARARDDRGVETDSPPIRIGVLESVNLPEVTVEATDPRGSEGGLLTVIGAAVFMVHRTGDTTLPLTVRCRIGGTAENGVDYHRLPLELEIPAGSRSAFIEVNPLVDSLEEGIETVIVELEEPVCAAEFPPPPGCYRVGNHGWAIAGIADGPGVGNAAPRAEIVRPFPGAVYHAPADIPVVTQARDRDGYTTLVEWFANERKIGEQSRQYITPPPPGGMHVFEFVWRGVPPGRYLLTARATDNQGGISPFSEPVPVTVLPAEEIPVVTLFVEDPIASEQPGADGTVNTATFAVRRSGPVEQSLTVFYEVRGTAENGVDFLVLDRPVTIPAGSRWARLTVEPIADGRAEDPETVVVELVPSPTLGPMEPYRVGSPSLAAALILDAGDLTVSPDRVRNWLHLSLPAIPGAAYRLEASPDLVHWEAVADRWADESGVHQIEVSPGESPIRFYRVRPLAPEIMENPALGGDEW